MAKKTKKMTARAFIIVSGNPVDGFSFYGDAEGKAFESHDDAVEAAEAEHWEDGWWVAPVRRITD